jgi:hypothetical protein
MCIRFEVKIVTSVSQMFDNNAQWARVRTFAWAVDAGVDLCMGSRCTC